MAHQIPTTEPAEVAAGETWTWKKSLDDYPASVWTLRYYLSDGTNRIEIVASADGDAYLVAVDAATTATKAAGNYRWVAQVSDGSDVYTVGAGAITVGANVSLAQPFDARSFAEKLLDAVNSALLGKATREELDLISSAYGDRSRNMDPAQLRIWQSQLQYEVGVERGDIDLFKTTQVRFPHA